MRALTFCSENRGRELPSCPQGSKFSLVVTPYTFNGRWLPLLIGRSRLFSFSFIRFVLLIVNIRPNFTLSLKHTHKWSVLGLASHKLTEFRKVALSKMDGHMNFQSCCQPAMPDTVENKRGAHCAS
ncbi:hypothetical protein O6H91_14G036300 [Diphasiastrum complanatum]|uniref:Uncharacterized protein n=1 Tax=Diphasiastrum complanatum TaxID=34168 RepID=A0ACC2BN50_DIPCM|nr:hypothetical protein O6H91_14G036300 [Diphasiastrum complanatum]